MLTNQTLNDVRELSLNDRTRTLNDIFYDFNFEDVKNHFSQNKHMRNSYECLCKFETSGFNTSLDWEAAEFQEVIDMKMALFYESYGSGLMEMGFVLMTFANPSMRLSHPHRKNMLLTQLNELIGEIDANNRESMGEDSGPGSVSSQSQSAASGDSQAKTMQ